MISLNQIRIDGGTQSRTELNQDVVAEYAEAYRAGTRMPPIVVFYDGSSFWLADGFHRYFGAKDAGLTEIYEERQLGTQRDAVLYSLGANAKHGLRRSNADKRKAVETLLADDEWGKWSDVQIAKACGISDKTVAAHRHPIIGNSEDRNSEAGPESQPEDVLTCESPAVRTVTRNGKTYQQDTANIGAKAAPAKQATVDGECERIEDPNAAELSEIEELRDFCDVQGQNLKASIEENESMGRVFEADYRIVAALAEAKRFRELNRVLTERNTGLMNELAEAIKLVKTWKRRAERAEKEASHAA